MGRIEGKACIVTGAASGIGRATAVRFAEEGGQVLCVDLDGDGASETAERIRANGGSAEAQEADVAVREQAEGFVARCVCRVEVARVRNGKGHTANVAGRAAPPQVSTNAPERRAG